MHYEKFLQKCCTSSDIYDKIKRRNAHLDLGNFNFDTIFFIINLLKRLFPAVEKISQLGRYYESKGGKIPRMYTLVAATQALRLYTTLKTIVLEMVNNH